MADLSAMNEHRDRGAVFGGASENLTAFTEVATVLK